MTDKTNWYMEDESIRRLIDSASSPWDEYRLHPGQVALQKWADVKDFYQGVVIANEIILLNYLKAPIESGKIRKRLIKSAGESQYRVEATRRLYNYLSSIASLADHTRNLLKSYEGQEFAVEYATRLRLVTGLKEFAFLKDLRNYAAHYQIPPIGYIVGTSNLIDSDVAFLPLIYTGDLFDYDGWSTGSKRYMKENFPNIELIKLVSVYAQSINDLYEWLFEQFGKLHGNDLEDSEILKHKIINNQVPNQEGTPGPVS